RPRRAEINAVEHVGEVLPTRQVAEADLVELVADEVHGIRKEILVGAALDEAELEVLVAYSQLVGVELDFLGGVHRALPPAVDLVIEPLHGALVVPVPFEKQRW